MPPPPDSRPLRKHLIASLLMALAAVVGLWPDPVAAADAERPRLAVSVSVLGPEGGSITPAQMVAALAEGGWCEPKAVTAARWNRRPEAAGDAPWLSVVLTGFGERADALGFLFDADGSPPRLAAHVPYGKTLKERTMVWIVPIGSIAFAIRDFVEAAATPRPSPPPVVGLVVKERAEEPTAEKGTAGLAGLSGTRAASNVDAVRALPAIEALVAAALLQNGLAPGPADAAGGIEADVRFGVKVASFRVARRGGAAAAERVVNDVPEDQYFDHLLRTVMVLGAESGGTADFFRPDGTGPLQLLAATSDRLAVATAAGLAIFDAVSGGRIHPAPNAKGVTHAPGRYVGLAGATGEANVFRITEGLARIDATGGAATPLATRPPGRTWAFGIAAGGAAVASDRTLSLFRGGTAAAWRHDEPAAITAGPAVQGDRVFAGLEDGGFVCRDLADGAERWRNGTPQGNWHGPIGCFAGRILAYDRNGRSLAAFDPADGRTLWTQPLGDVLVATPSQAGDRILVAGKNNRVIALKPADGTIAAEVRWPTWLVSVVAIPGRRPLVACADIHGDISFLDAATLETVRTVRLPARLSGPLLFHPAFPTSWGRPARAAGDDADDLADELDRTFVAATPPIPAVLAADVNGFCYVVRVPQD